MSLARRRFDPITVPVENGRRRVHRLICSACGTTHDVSANTHGGSRATEDLLKIWRRAGWEVGGNSHDDRCPTCSSLARKAKREKRAEPETIKTAEIIPMPTPINATAEPPTEPTREDRRVIFAKLNEVYIDEKTGYGSGWSDKKVAEDLGVPRAWVASVREEHFGPEKSSEDVRKAIAEAEAFCASARTILAETEKERTRIENMLRGLATMTSQVQDALSVVKERQTKAFALVDEARRIERTLADIKRAVAP